VHRRVWLSAIIHRPRRAVCRIKKVIGKRCDIPFADRFFDWDEEKMKKCNTLLQFYLIKELLQKKQICCFKSIKYLRFLCSSESVGNGGRFFYS